MHTNTHTEQLCKLEAWTVEQLTGTLERVKEAVEEVTGSLSMTCTGLFDDVFTISKTSQTERWGKAEGSFLSGLNQDKTLEPSSAFSPAEAVMCAWERV